MLAQRNMGPKKCLSIYVSVFVSLTMLYSLYFSTKNKSYSIAIKCFLHNTAITTGYLTIFNHHHRNNYFVYHQIFIFYFF